MQDLTPMSPLCAMCIVLLSCNVGKATGTNAADFLLDQNDGYFDLDFLLDKNDGYFDLYIYIYDIIRR